MREPNWEGKRFPKNQLNQKKMNLPYSSTISLAKLKRTSDTLRTMLQADLLYEL